MLPRSGTAALALCLALAAAPGAVRAGETCRFQRELRLAPGEYYAVRYDPLRRDFVEEEPDRGWGRLGKDVLLQLLRAPAWLREDLADRLADLASEEIDVGSDAAPAFHDVNGDGKDDLVVGCAEGSIRCFLAPDFRELRDGFGPFKTAGGALPCFFDLDGDGTDELLAGTADGRLLAWKLPGGGALALKGDLSFSGQVCPSARGGSLEVRDAAGRSFALDGSGGFRVASEEEREDDGSSAELMLPGGRTLRVSGMPDGSLSVSGLSDPGEGLCRCLARIKVSGKARPAFQDLNGDGAPELILGAADGTLSVFPNRGRRGEPWFPTYSEGAPPRFPGNVGFMSAPRIADLDGDGVADLVSGGQDGKLRLYPGPDFKEREGFFDSLRIEGASASVPAPGDFNGDGLTDLAVGFADGTIRIFRGPDFVLDEARSRGMKLASHAAPCAADMDGDGRTDLVAGSGDGKIVLFRNAGDRFVEEAKAFGGLEAGAYPCPAVLDVDADGAPDLALGNRAGEIRLFLGPGWKRAPGDLGVSMTGPYSAPAFGDLDGDGDPDLVVGSLEGGFIGFEREAGLWAEKGAWRFEPAMGLEKVTDYFERCHVQSEKLRGRVEGGALEAIRKLFSGTEDKLFDEVAFSVAFMPTEILRAMTRVGEEEVLLENAKAIYDTASKVKYADVVEKADHTTLSVRGQGGAATELPRDIYYWWVVHPRLYAEIPLRVNAAFWEKDAAAQGVTEEEWTRREIDLAEIGRAAGGTFWRRYLAENRKYGKNLLEVAAGAENALEAVYLIGDWVSQATPQSWFTYGLKSNDLQPNVIYQKNYGSCGEASILGAACARTMLIPAGCAGCGGEDHIWDEFWMDGEWRTWDLCTSSSKLRHPWECCERAEHKGTQILTITRRRGDDLVEATTSLVAQPENSGSTRSGKGYTDTGRITVRVVDRDGRPVEGAAVVVRSDCQRYWRTSVWNYTDPEGVCVLELGRPQRRCMIDVVSQQGLTGTAHFPVEENREYALTYVLADSFGPPAQAPARRDPEAGREGGRLLLETEVLYEEQRPRNLQTAQKTPKTETEFFKKTGFTGTRWYRHPNAQRRGVIAAILTPSEFENFKRTGEIPSGRRVVEGERRAAFDAETGLVALYSNPNRFTHVRFRTGLTAAAEAAPPEIALSSAPERGATGETLLFEGRAADNLRLAALEFSADGGATWKDVTDRLDRSTGRFSFAWDTGEGGPAAPGNRSILFRARDGSGLESTTPARALRLEAGRSFTGQKIFQDDPESPLPKSSWVLGPFTLKGKERFLGILSRSAEPDFDMDLFLFHDKNGNRRLDGAEEEKAKAATPTAAEKIALDDPPGGVYWIYCQGWQVKEKPGSEAAEALEGMPGGRLLSMNPDGLARGARFALLDLLLSFDWAPVLVTDLVPLGTVPAGDVEVRASFPEGSGIDLSSLRVLVDGGDLTSRALVREGSLSLVLKGLERDREVEVVVEAADRFGNSDRASWKFRTAHRPLEIKAEVSGDEKLLSLEARGREGRRLERAEARRKSKDGSGPGPWQTLEIAEDGETAKGALSLEGLGKGQYLLEIIFSAGGKEETQETAFTLKRGPQKERLLWIYPEDGRRIHDFRPALSVAVLGENGKKTKALRLFLDGAEITARCRLFGACAKFFPSLDLAGGAHVLEAEAVLEDGTVIREKSEFTISVMGEEEY